MSEQRAEEVEAVWDVGLSGNLAITLVQLVCLVYIPLTLRIRTQIE